MNPYLPLIKRLATGVLAALLVVCCLWTLAWAQANKTGIVNRNANLRAGPGTTYAVVGRVTQGQTVTLVSTNGAGD